MKIIILLTWMTSIQAGVVNKLIFFIKADCPSVRKILVKKSMIELLSNNLSCNGKFTSSLLAKCESIDCEEFLTKFLSLREQESGAVIGR